jgi:hypothetical protein
MTAMLGYTIAALACSFIVHHGLFIHGEWHLEAPKVLAYHIFTFIAIFWLEVLGASSSASQGCLRSIVVSTTYTCGLWFSISIYRLFFHRLRGFPGPRLAALSKLWHVWKCRSSRGHIVLQDWHRKYGTFVRTGNTIRGYRRCIHLTLTGPTEITIFHAAAFEAMDGPKNSNRRSDLYDLLYPRISSIFTRDKKVHETRRKTWDQALSMSGKAARDLRN